MYDLTNFTLSDVTRCGAELRRLGDSAASMEEAARRVVQLLYQSLGNGAATSRACALVRTFVTLPYAQLQPEQQAFAARVFLDVAHHPDTKCLTLLATAGDEHAWNDRRSSVGHQALPLPSEDSVSRSPMISQLMRQLGIGVGALLQTGSAMMLDDAQHTFNVFHVPDALGSPHIPAQNEFVAPFRIRSVVGFGGLLPPGELFATILFTRAPVSRSAAELFKPLALNVKLALLPFAGVKVFD
ncbi:MAG TPA: hypothetical protein VHV78_05850 [Gemmatimonadaceae bacterium]|jgi:hypothetical protein|nr:hypothetical protein [Gemmatimonadaceae bacterium]